MKLEVIESEFKGHPILIFKNETGFWFSIGLAKANAIVENIDKVKEFIKYDE